MARLPCARRAADAVHIGLGLHGQVVVHDMGDIVDVESARGDIGRDEDGRAPRAEGVERADALVLRLVAVDRLRADVRGLQLARQAVRAVLRLREDDGAVHLEGVEEMDEELRLLRLEHEVELLVDAVDRARDGRDGDLHGVAQERVREVADLLRHGRREEHRLPLRGEQRRDLADRLDEAHVEHAVCLVEHEEVDLAEVDEPLLQEVDETPRRRDEDIDSLLERADLRALPHAAEDDGVAKRRVAAVACEALADLRGQFARRRKDEHLRLAAERRARAAGHALEQVVQDRQRERRRLSRARLRDAEDIAARDRGRNRLRLDGRGMLVAVRDERVEQGLGEMEAGERNGTDGRRSCRHKHLSPAALAAGFIRGGIAFGRLRRRDGIKPIGARGAGEHRVPQVGDLWIGSTGRVACCRLSPSRVSLRKSARGRPESPAEEEECSGSSSHSKARGQRKRALCRIEPLRGVEAVALDAIGRTARARARARARR